MNGIIVTGGLPFAELKERSLINNRAKRADASPDFSQLIFFGFSLVAPPNATSTLALVASAFSVACAVFLILELDHPLGGLIRIPSEPMINVLNHLAK